MQLHIILPNSTDISRVNYEFVWFLKRKYLVLYLLTIICCDRKDDWWAKIEVFTHFNKFLIQDNDLGNILLIDPISDLAFDDTGINIDDCILAWIN